MSRAPARRSEVDSGRAIIVVRPGLGTKVDNVEFLARSTDTPRFNLGIVIVEPHHDGPDPHVHDDEDDAFFVLEGQLTVRTPEDRCPNVIAGPGTFVLVPPGAVHTFANHGDARVRMLNIHAPGGFDRRLGPAQPARPSSPEPTTDRTVTS